MNSRHEVKRSIRSTTYKFNAVCVKQSEKNARICGKNNSSLLHHDNAPAHASLLVHEFLAKNNTVTMPQPPYSPDMAPCNFFLFPKIKRTLKGRRFAAIDDIKSASLKELKAIPKIEFEKCFEDWKKPWHKCIISNGDYFEGDNINVDE